MKKIIHITSGKGGEFEMVQRISSYMVKNSLNNSVISLKANKDFFSLNLKNFFFDEDWISIKSLKALKKEIPIDSIIFFHCIENLSNLFILIFLKLFRSKKIITIFHGSLGGTGFFLKKIFIKIRKILISNISNFLSIKNIFVSFSQFEDFKKIIFGKKSFKKKSCIFENFLPDWFQINSKEKAFDQIRLIYVGSFSFFKGFKDILDLWNDFDDQSNISLYVAGSGKLKPEIKNYKNIKDLGQVPSSEIISCYDQCNFLFFPSYSESFGLVIVEAMARGLVILASDIPAIREIIQPERNGFLFPPGNLKKMKETILYCQKNPDLMKQISRNNLLDAEKFSEQNLGENYLFLAKNLIEI